ncbi:hybrid-cluster NAD(P)-dependent oxidoreductase [Leeia sp. TBRC 13508]|uniref:Hybrid-cluster NAD(P)-dependent oxidoreductase n=1 Tax=Leeia speluncae TaxID=2884804 RepID=A0ABS8D9Z2_9NEIS|nr:hybrid-cluster NAD(P)-dependent oxidoreductase [Leeia speluncae]MCB6184977.1 hybrid-cluster NAD(P)-dependent oxidoreductase [Leeia speluncae]
MNQLVNTHLAATGSTKVDPVLQAATWELPLPTAQTTGRHTLICRSVQQETHDVKTFTFSTPDYARFYFEPGQFLTLTLEINGEMVSRCYTISSSPTRPHSISITVKRVTDGLISNWLHDHLKVDDEVGAFDPAGEFTPVGIKAEKLLLLSAGSGITPSMSMARAYADLGIKKDIVFVHNARSPKDIIFHHELVRFTQLNPHFKLVTICDQPGEKSDYDGLIGRLDAAVLATHIPDFAEREVFVCGPAGYMSYVNKLLLDHGFPAKQYHQESFSIETVTPVTTETNPDTCKIELTKSGKTFEVKSTDNLMLMIKSQGVPVPSSCGQGVCGTCKTKLVSGQVEMKHQGGIRQREIDKGFILLCCSKPVTPKLVLEL